MELFDKEVKPVVQSPPAGKFSSFNVQWQYLRLSNSPYPVRQVCHIPYDRVADFIRGEAENPDHPTTFRIYSSRRRRRHSKTSATTFRTYSEELTSSKQAHFLLVKKTIKADHMARIFMSQMFKHHGMSKSIVGDRDPPTASLFWRALFDNMGTKLNVLSDFHPQMDGQSEAANATVLDLLKCYVADQKTLWKKYLSLIEFACNNTVHTSTGKALFEIIYGKVVLPSILRIKDEIFVADDFVKDLDIAFAQVRTVIERSQKKHKRVADKHRKQ